MKTAKSYPDIFDQSHLRAIIKRTTTVGDCFVWGGATSKKDGRGYGRIRISKRAFSVHRIIYTVINGRIPDGLVILHICDNPLCCNVEHMRAGTQQDNVTDMVSKGRLRSNPLRGEDSPISKISGESARFIKKNHIPFDSKYGTTPLAKRFGISLAQVSRIAHGTRWANV